MKNARMLMQGRSLGVLVGIVLALSVMILFTGCDSDDDEDGEAGASRIQGNVAQVLMAANQPGEPSSTFAQWKSLFTVPVAHAQGNMLEGITVTVLQGGVVLTTDETDAQGNFVLEFSEGEETLTLQFATPTFTVSTSLDVAPGSTVVIVVTLSPTAVTVTTQIELDEEEDEDGDGDDDSEEEQLPPIRCTGGRVEIAQGDTLVIDGAGTEACVRAEGNCQLELSFQEIVLQDCEQCLRAEGNTTVTLRASGAIHCEAQEDGVRAEGSTNVTLDAESITIDAPATGIRAEGNASVEFDTPVCTIENADEPFRIEGNASVTGCEEETGSSGGTPL